MIKYFDGDILDSTADAIVIPVNTVGVAGKGLALQMKKKNPYWYMSYRKYCLDNAPLFTVGNVLRYEWYKGDALYPTYIYSVPTKRSWREKSELYYIRIGCVALKLDLLHFNLKYNRIHSVAIPALGCGCGELNWSEVEPIIVNEMSTISHIDFHIYRPYFPLQVEK